MRLIGKISAALVTGLLALPAPVQANIDEEIAALERENENLKKRVRLEALKRENAELRKQLDTSEKQGGSSRGVAVRQAKPSVPEEDATRVTRPAREAFAYGTRNDEHMAYYKAPVHQFLRPRWEGFSMGFHAGMGFGNWSSTATASSSYGDLYRIHPDTSSVLGAVAGFQVGYAWQLGAFVFGPEADLSVGSVKAASLRSASISNAGAGFYSSFTNENLTSADWLSSVRGKIGFAADDWLFFGSVGLALQGFEATRFFGGTASDVAVGYAVGGGLSYAVSSNLSARLEYLRYAFRDHSLRYDSNGFTSITTIDPTTNVVRAGLDWRLN